MSLQLLERGLLIGCTRAQPQAGDQLPWHLPHHHVRARAARRGPSRPSELDAQGREAPVRLCPFALQLGPPLAERSIKVRATGHEAADLGEPPASIEWGVGVEPEDLDRFLAEDADR
jgi:hypothetical protein